MTREVIEYLKVDEIECDRQVRTQVTDESVIGLARSIQEARGLLQPIRVRRDGARYVVVDGERRLRAARLIKLSEISAIVEPKPLDDGATLQRQLIANIQREDLPPCEKARGIQRLVDVTKRPLAEVAGMLGLSKSTASRLLALNSLPEEIQQGVEDGKIPASAGYSLSRIEDREKQSALACQVAEGKLTRDEVADVVKSAQNGDAEREVAPLKHVKVMIDGLTVTVAGESGVTWEIYLKVIQALHSKSRKAYRQGQELKSFGRSTK